MWAELSGKLPTFPTPFPSSSLAMLPSVLFACLFPELGCVLCDQPNTDKPHLDFFLLFFWLGYHRTEFEHHSCMKAVLAMHPKSPEDP